jgi:putative hemolysin
MTSEHSARVGDLRRAILEEMVKVLGLSPSARNRLLLGPLFWPPAHRFASVAAFFDRMVADNGLQEAARWALTQFATKLKVRRRAEVPGEGPLLIASNHPGTVDGLAIVASLDRPDLKIVASGLPFMRGLPSMGRHLIYVSSEPHSRAASLRSMIRHLRDGGSVLIFPSGNVDPDPAVLPGADRALEGWSRSLDLLLRSVPETRVLLSIVSDVVLPTLVQNPLTRLRKELRDRQKVAEFLQVSLQMLLRWGPRLTARLSLGEPLDAAELQRRGEGQGPTYALVENAKGLLADHLAWGKGTLRASG